MRNIPAGEIIEKRQREGVSLPLPRKKTVRFSQGTLIPFGASITDILAQGPIDTTLQDLVDKMKDNHIDGSMDIPGLFKDSVSDEIEFIRDAELVNRLGLRTTALKEDYLMSLVKAGEHEVVFEFLVDKTNIGANFILGDKIMVSRITEELLEELSTETFTRIMVLAPDWYLHDWLRDTFDWFFDSRLVFHMEDLDDVVEQIMEISPSELLEMIDNGEGFDPYDNFGAVLQDKIISYTYPKELLGTQAVYFKRHLFSLASYGIDSTDPEIMDTSRRMLNILRDDYNMVLFY